MRSIPPFFFLPLVQRKRLPGRSLQNACTRTRLAITSARDVPTSSTRGGVSGLALHNVATHCAWETKVCGGEEAPPNEMLDASEHVAVDRFLCRQVRSDLAWGKNCYRRLPRPSRVIFHEACIYAAIKHDVSAFSCLMVELCLKARSPNARMRA